jgi:predicted O-methyltransferase YrrM
MSKLTEGGVMIVALAIPGLIIEEDLRFLYQVALTAAPGGEFVELGTFKGRSCAILCYAAGAREQTPWTIDDYSYTVASSAEIVTANLHAYGLAAHIIVGDSRKPPAGIGAVSCLFIDSTHTAEHFRAEAAAWLPKIVKGGVVVCHDYQHTKWHEMRAVIDETFGHGWTRLGVARSMIAFRKS